MGLERLVAALIAGLLFGSGLLLSGMTNPENILQFLDVTGDWSPALAVVMATAIVVAAPAFWWIRRRQFSLLDDPVNLDNKRPVDWPLVVGAAIFGIGWGLSGMCPGPSLMLAAGQRSFAAVFVVAMIAGMLLTPLVVNIVRREDG